MTAVTRQVGSKTRSTDDRIRPPRKLPRYLNPLGVGFVFAVILLWQLLVSTGTIHSSYIPSPWQIWTTGVQLVATGEMWAPVVHTVLAALIGWSIAVVIGLGLGLALGLLPRVYTWSIASIDVIRSIPAVTFVPVFSLIFGVSLLSEVIVIIYVASWATLFNTLAGVQSVRPGLRDTARVLHLSRAEVVRKIVLPSAAPQILVGLRLSMGLSLALAIVGELLIDPAGIGYAMLQAEQQVQPEQLFVYVIAVGMLGYLLNLALVIGARYALPAPILSGTASRSVIRRRG